MMSILSRKMSTQSWMSSGKEANKHKYKKYNNNINCNIKNN